MTTNTSPITLRDLAEPDIGLIGAWPTYRAEYAEMDKYLRKGGLPEAFYRDPQTRAFAAIGPGQDLIGLCALIEETARQAEFVVFIRDDAIGKGIGERVSRLILEKAFCVFRYEKLDLVVRQHKRKEQRLYVKLGFRVVSECHLEREGRMIPFYRMVLSRRDYSAATA